jgi:hypothetical protein
LVMQLCKEGKGSMVRRVLTSKVADRLFDTVEDSRQQLKHLSILQYMFLELWKMTNDSNCKIFQLFYLKT